MKAAKTKKEPSSTQQDELLAILEARFEKHKSRHPGVKWEKVKAWLEARPEKLRSLGEMDATGGEPDVGQTRPHASSLRLTRNRFPSAKRVKSWARFLASPR